MKTLRILQGRNRDVPQIVGGHTNSRYDLSIAIICKRQVIEIYHSDNIEYDNLREQFTVRYDNFRHKMPYSLLTAVPVSYMVQDNETGYAKGKDSLGH